MRDDVPEVVAISAHLLAVYHRPVPGQRLQPQSLPGQPGIPLEAKVEVLAEGVEVDVVLVEVGQGVAQGQLGRGGGRPVPYVDYVVVCITCK